MPAELRKRYGIEPNSKIEFIDTGEEIVIVPLRGEDHFRGSYGILREVSSKAVVRNRRRDRGRQNRRTGRR